MKRTFVIAAALAAAFAFQPGSARATQLTWGYSMTGQSVTNGQVIFSLNGYASGIQNPPQPSPWALSDPRTNPADPPEYISLTGLNNSQYDLTDATYNVRGTHPSDVPSDLEGPFSQELYFGPGTYAFNSEGILLQIDSGTYASATGSPVLDFVLIQLIDGDEFEITLYNDNGIELGTEDVWAVNEARTNSGNFIETPEPSSLLLTTTGVTVLALLLFWKRKTSSENHAARTKAA